MMQFLTKKILKSDKALSPDCSCTEKLKEVEAEIEFLKAKLKEQNQTLRQFSILNDNLCTEISVIGRWIVNNFAKDDSELTQKFGIFDSEDDEYLN